MCTGTISDGVIDLHTQFEIQKGIRDMEEGNTYYFKLPKFLSN